MLKTNAEIKIVPININLALPIRQQVMWPNKPISYVQLPQDPLGEHFGLYQDKTLTSIISVFMHEKEAQFRKFATLPFFQGRGFGSRLLRYTLTHLEEQNVERVWCNARIEKKKYYEKFGLKTTAKRFEKGGKQYAIMERWFTTPKETLS